MPKRLKYVLSRGSHQRCSAKINVLNFAKNSQESIFVGVSFLIKLQAAAGNFIKKEALSQVFPCEFRESFKNIFFTEHLLLLSHSKDIMFYELFTSSSEVIGSFFFPIWIFFHDNLRFTGQQRGRKRYFFNSSLPFPPASLALRH